MSMFFITFRSVTPAQRGEGLLRKHGIQAALQRTPRWMEEKGCGYCLRLPPERVREAAQLLRSAQVPYRKIYKQDEDGSPEEVTL